MPSQSDAQVIAAFTAASGIPIETLIDAIRLVLGGVALIWFVWAASRIGTQALRDRLSWQKAWNYLFRAAVLTTLVLLVLTR